MPTSQSDFTYGNKVLYLTNAQKDHFWLNNGDSSAVYQYIVPQTTPKTFKPILQIFHFIIIFTQSAPFLYRTRLIKIPASINERTNEIPDQGPGSKQRRQRPPPPAAVDKDPLRE